MMKTIGIHTKQLESVSCFQPLVVRMIQFHMFYHLSRIILRQDNQYVSYFQPLVVRMIQFHMFYHLSRKDNQYASYFQLLVRMIQFHMFYHLSRIILRYDKSLGLFIGYLKYPNVIFSRERTIGCLLHQSLKFNNNFLIRQLNNIRDFSDF